MVSNCYALFVVHDFKYIEIEAAVFDCKLA